MERFDVIVIGLGAMGSAATYQLAKGGAKVLGIDRFEPPHASGSSHGDTRITRRANFEGDEYVPLASRSHEIWRDIERQTGARLFTANGCLIYGSTGHPGGMHGAGNATSGTIAVAKRCGIAHEELDAAALARRFPQFRYGAGDIGVLETDAGFLLPEACVETQIRLAKSHGAMVRTGERMLRFDATAGGVAVTTDKGTYEARTLVLTAGPWIGELLPEHAETFKVYRQVLYWFKTSGPITDFEPARLPVFVHDLPGGATYYGFPAIDGPDGGIKIAREEYRSTASPDTIERRVSPQEVADMFALVSPHIPQLTPECVRTATCMYTVTPDSKFVIDRHPSHENVIIASPCSGHGFKHSAAIGEALAQLAMTGKSDIDLSPFSLKRFPKSA